MSNLQAEQSLGKYRIVNELGRGGFATVYLAHDTVLRRSVALKVLHPILLTDPAFVTRFETEARAIAQFEHPHIATIYELGHYDGRLCIAIQFLPGGALVDRIRQHGSLSFADAVRAIGDVAGALDHAHTAGFIHRDVKPSNILFNTRGDAVLTDFGLVKAAESSVIARTTMGSLLGTPPYMAPEVWEGSGDSPRTDVYALGCVLFEMLTGELLFKGDTPPAVMLTHFQPHKYPERWSVGTPPNVTDLLERALARAPIDRYASAGELATDLRALAARPADPLATSYQALEVALAARQWESAEELAPLISAQDSNYRDVRELARQAAEGKAQDKQAQLATHWREQALAAERAGRLADARNAVEGWLAAAPADAQAEALRERLGRSVIQARPAPAEPVVEGRRGQITSSVGEREQGDHPQAPRVDSASVASTAPRRSLWPSLFLIIIGCALAGTLLAIIDPSGFYNWRFAWIISGATAGAIMGYALRRVTPTLHLSHVLLIAASWTAGALVSNAVAGIPLGCAVGAIITALVLRWVEPALQWKRIFLMLVGWPVGFGVGVAILNFIDFIDWYLPYSGLIVIGGLLGACFGLGGGAAMIWQLRRLPAIAAGTAATEAPEPMPVAAVPVSKALVSFALTTFGWAASFALAWSIVEILSRAIGRSTSSYLWISAIAWGISGALGGAATAVVLQRTHPAIGRNRAVSFMTGWSLGMALVWLLGAPLVGSLANAWGTLPALAIDCMLMALAGGIVTSRAVANTYATLRWRHTLIIVLGWTIGLLIAWTISLSQPLMNQFMNQYFFPASDFLSRVGGFLLYVINWPTWALIGAIFGAIGGGVMFWQIYRASRSAETGVR